MYAALLCAGQVLFKLSAPADGLRGGVLKFLGGLLQNPVFITGCAIYAVSTLAWVAILARFQLSYAYPFVIAVSILLTSSMGILIFKEQLNFHKLAGITVVMLGVFILSKSNLQ